MELEAMDLSYGMFFTMLDAFCGGDVVDLAARLAPDHVALAELLANLRKAKQVIGDAAQYVEDELVKAMPHKSEIVEGVGEVTYHTGAKRSAWDKESLVAVATHAIGSGLPTLADPEDGTLMDGIAFTSMVLTEFLGMATPSWKVTGLRAVGINPDEFCETVWGRKTIEMPLPDTFIPMPHVEGSGE